MVYFLLFLVMSTAQPARIPDPVPPAKRKSKAKRLESSIKFILAVVTLIGAYQAYLAYRSSLQEKMFEYKLDIYHKLISSAGDLNTSKPEDFGAQLDQFRVVERGAADMLGDPAVSAAGLVVYNAGVGIYNQNNTPAADERDSLDDAVDSLYWTCGQRIRAEFPEFAGKGN